MDAATTTSPAPLTPAACRLVGQIDAQLKSPAAMLAPAGLRAAVQQLGGLVLALAQRVDTLTAETGKGA